MANRALPGTGQIQGFRKEIHKSDLGDTTLADKDFECKK